MSTGKGKKRVKGTPVLYDEIKRRRTVLLTDTAWALLMKSAQKQVISISELVEAWARTQDGE